MRRYLYLILTISIFNSYLYAEEEKINECMSDIYFANGINTKRTEAREQLDNIIRKEVLISQFNLDEEKMNKAVDFKLAYNNTMGIAFDLLESYGQKKAEHGTFWWTLGTMYDVFGGIAKQGLKELTSEGLEALIVETLKKTASQFIVDPLLDEVGLKDLASLIKDLRSGKSPSNVWQTLVDATTALENYDTTKQLGSYKNSIKLGHSAIVIAHSQGNLFTNVVYNKIATDPTDKWMTKYFYMIGVASPAGEGSGPKDIEIVTFDNDPISYIPDSIGVPIRNPMRYIGRVYSRDDNEGTKPGTCLDRQYADGSVPSSCVDISDSEYDFWSPFDKGIIDFHLFSYYMSTEVSKTKIMNFVDSSLKAHSEAKSQWIQDEETNKDTCEYKITLKHEYDTSIEMPLDVYPFNASKKLYQVNGEWVKASCGGENILGLNHDIPTWDGKQDNECLMIDNVEEEKIELGQMIKFYAYYEFSVYYNRTIWPYLYAHISFDTFSTEINSSAQLRVIKYNQRECRTPHGIGLTPDTDYFYFNSDSYIDRLENTYIFKFDYNTISKSTIKCVLNKNEKNLDDIEKIERGKVTYENFISQDNGNYKRYFIEYIIHTD